MKKRSFFSQNLATPLIFAVAIFIYYIVKNGFTTAVIAQALLTSVLFALFYILFGRLFRKLRGSSSNDETEDNNQN